MNAIEEEYGSEFVEDVIRTTYQSNQLATKTIQAMMDGAKVGDKTGGNGR
jgi:hypothetical protein